MWVQIAELSSNSVMFPEPDRVHGEQPQLFICPHISSQEASNAGAARIPAAVDRLPVVERKERFAVVVRNSLPQSSVIIRQVPQAGGQVKPAPVHLVNVNVRQDHYYILN